jgi:hypothetical protein
MTKMPSATLQKLEAAFEIATFSLDRVERCRDLFGQLGADGLELLGTARYRIASASEEAMICGRATAFTSIGLPIVTLCRNFSRHSDPDAAAIILHEALHQAGLGESPVDRDALTSTEITNVVLAECRLADSR